jgi:tRNA (guanine37-N1)-methyltransferase
VKVFIITLFPEVIQTYLNTSIMKKAQEKGVIFFSIIPLRDFGIGKHRQVDDYPYGGGPGMLLRPEPVFEAVDSILKTGENPHKIFLSPQGKRFKQDDAKNLSKKDSLLFFCGHYEGFDERIRISLADEEISIGDYVLTGGELPVLVIIDAVARMVEGVLPKESIESESFYDYLLEYPQYTRPAEYRGMKVPELLLSGNHREIEKWRKQKAVERTIERSAIL